MPQPWRLAVAVLLLALALPAAAADDDKTLSADLWRWRAIEAPFSADDILRIERPDGFLVDWSAAAVARHLHTLETFGFEWDGEEAYGMMELGMITDRLID